MNHSKLWQRYNHYLCSTGKLGISIDISRMRFEEQFLYDMRQPMQRAYEAMDALERGAIANPDENRMVGHYWLRAPQMAPSEALITAITSARQAVLQFASDVHSGRIAPPNARRFTDLLLIGIGGSALGPQLVAEALGGAGGAAGRRDKMRLHFFDNTDPDGFNRLLLMLGARLKNTLVVVISKSGTTKETRNGMLAVQHAFASVGLDFARQTVAVTGENSQLDQLAQKENWLARFPMWDWVGGRTSVMSAVGLLPAALQGVDIRAMLDGAAAMDEITRQHDTRHNPAALLALMWHHATRGRGEKDMVILPYKDRLLLMSRYLQQLVMESLGKETDMDGNIVHQGIAVYGNKGSTDQHAFVQQLREGVNNFFVTFIVVLQDAMAMRSGKAAARDASGLKVEPDITSGDYLNGFWQGTRQALYENERESITITLNRIDARTLGALIALYERAVGLYASLVQINAYHQPGVEAGKKAAEAVLQLQRRVLAHLTAKRGEALTVEEIAAALKAPDQIETIHHILMHLAANRRLRAARGRYQAV